MTVHGWTAHSASGSNPILVTSPGLTFNGYIGSGIGLAAGVNNTGEDDNKSFGAQTNPGSIYASFMVNATATSTAGDFFFHFFDPNANTAFRARTFILPGSVPGKMKVGLSFNATTTTNVTNDLNFGQTYLFVVKYTIVSGTLNDNVSLYVFAEGDNFSTEPTTPTIGPLTGTVADIVPTCVALRQFDASQRITVDGIRVKTIWQMGSDVATKVNGINENQSIGFYPNPVTDGVINLSNAGSSMKDVQIFDVVGKRVFNQQTISNRLDVSVLNAGIYVIKVSSDNQTSSSRLVIK